MICKECKKKIDRVRVFSRCSQLATVEGKKIIEYDSTEEIYETLSIECMDCGADITNLIKQL